MNLTTQVRQVTENDFNMAVLWVVLILLFLVGSFLWHLALSWRDDSHPHSITFYGHKVDCERTDLPLPCRECGAP